MAVKESRYKIIEEGGRRYIFAPQAAEYAKERLNTSFGVPSYRTIRYYVTKGVFERPLKRGKETYFNLDDIINEIMLIKELQSVNPALKDMQEIIPNIKRSGEWAEAAEALKPDIMFTFIKAEGKDKFLHKLATEKPSTIIKGLKGSGKSRLVKNIVVEVKKQK